MLFSGFSSPFTVQYRPLVLYSNALLSVNADYTAARTQSSINTHLSVGPCGARGHCRSPPRFLAECCKRRLNQGSFVSAVCLVVCLLWFVLCLCVCIFVIYIEFFFA